MKNLQITDLPSLKKFKRETLLDMLAESDRNGVFTDKQSKDEGIPKMTKKEALEVITRIVSENIVFEKDNNQIIQQGDKFFSRIIEDGEFYESGDFNTLEKAKRSLNIVPTIEDNNILLAEFMEFIRSYPNMNSESKLSKMYRYGKRDKVFPEGLYTFSIESLYGGDMGRVKHLAVIENCQAEDMPFNKSWDWLMPVVKKVKSLNIEEYHLIDDIDDALMNADIWLVYDSCIKFVLWYNDNKEL